MFPSSRIRTPQSDAESASRSGFSRFLKRASPGFQARSEGRDLALDPAQRRTSEDHSLTQDESGGWDESVRSETGIRRSASSTRLDSPSTASRRPLSRASAAAGAENRPNSRATIGDRLLDRRPDHQHPTATPSPQARYGPGYTSSPSPLARRSESRQSLYSQPPASVSHHHYLERSQSRQSASESSAAPSLFHHGSENRSHSRATTPKPGDFHDMGGEAFASSEDDDDDDDEQSTTPRSEMKRWKPSAMMARNDVGDRYTRYSSEPPLDSRPSTVVPRAAAERMTRRLSHGLIDTAENLEPGAKVEMWRNAREVANRGAEGGEFTRRDRAALPTEFRKDVTTPSSARSVSHYSRSTIDDSSKREAVHGTYPTLHRSAQSITSYTDSPIRRSESLRSHAAFGLFTDSPPLSSIKRSVTLHHARHATESIVASPVTQSRLLLGTPRSLRPLASDAGDSPSSAVGLQRAESRRRRAALLEEMSSTPPPPLNRSTSRLSHNERYVVTDARPTSRMSIINNGVGIRPSTSMSSFRFSNPAPASALDRHGYRSPMKVPSPRGYSANNAPREIVYPTTKTREHAPGPLSSRNERKSSGRESPTAKSTVSSALTHAGTSSRVAINRLLAAVRESTGHETQEMLHACIALQQNLVDRADDTDIQFKQSCQTVAIDANQINANLKAALDIVNHLSQECEASTPEDAQIATISAMHKLVELIGNSSKASDEKIKSLHMLFNRLGSYTDKGTLLPLGSENTPHALPIVQEDAGPVDTEESPQPTDQGVNDVQVGAQAPADPEVSTATTSEAQESINPDTAPSGPDAKSDEQVVVSHTLESNPTGPDTTESNPTAPLKDAPSDVADPKPLESAGESITLVPAPSSSEISPAQLRTRARKASSSSISVSLSPNNIQKMARSPLPPTLTHKASFMPSSLSLRTPTTALSRINAGTADEPGFDFDVNPQPKPVAVAEVEVEETAFRLNPLQLEIRTTPTAGRGVFATEDIPAAGTVVEESPVLVLTKKEWDDGLLNDGVLGGYGFNWTAGGMGVGLGIASMFNHSPQPNVMFTRIAPRESEKTKYPTLIFRTTKPIKKGDELYICYSADESKLWFSPNYVAGDNRVDAAPEEGEWAPPMMDEENELPAQNTANDMGASVKSETAATAEMTTEDASAVLQNDTGSVSTEEQKYIDRKARKQTKREKKVKKPKTEGTLVQQESLPETASEPSINPAVNGNDATTAGDPSCSLSPLDYADALSKLSLIPEIEIQAEDIDRERALAEDEETSSETRQDNEDEVAWRLVRRVRGLAEAQESDNSRTGVLFRRFMRFALLLNYRRLGLLHSRYLGTCNLGQKAHAGGPQVRFL
ncbi:hypothetical protein QFC19_000159 [Naganishia cerealis]|uniref:Uncharacterized protein n=1 Tax=Naganishia cerealis TaxID=610337 RepID=A0ACC2WQA6_9TREE|nr:hypothetical protein QFC19_000159 [Naganishia cerealis]